MPCPTCSHTMQNLGLATNGRRTFWCSRCGTIKTEAEGLHEVAVPKLVGHVRQGNADAFPMGDGRTTQYAVRAWPWLAACEAAGVKPPQ